MIDYIQQIPGPDFLKYYSIFSIACIIVAWLFTRLDRTFFQNISNDSSLAPVEIALLNNKSYDEIILAVIQNLWHKKLITIEPIKENSPFLHITPTPKPIILQGLEKAVYDSIADTYGSSKSILADTKLKEKAEPFINASYQSLKDNNMLKNMADKTLFFFNAIIFFSIMAGIGITKLSLGISRQKPVTYLALLLTFFSIAYFFTIIPGFRLSWIGKKLLRKTKSHFNWARSAMPSDQDDNFLPVLLFGAACIDPLFMSHFKIQSQPVKSGWFSNSNSYATTYGCSGCSGSACSGGCAGGGCGGGCGGCGGD